MMKKLGIFGLVVLITAGTILYFQTSYRVSRQLNKAYENYQAGEKAETIAERKEAFNKALKTYKKLEESNDPASGNGKLYYNVGNSYFQLEQYPWAILNYHRALRLRPQDSKVQNNLSIAQKRLNISQAQTITPFKKVFFFHYAYSLPERLQIFAAFAIASILLGSLAIWLRNHWVQKIALAFCLGALMMFLSLGYTRYLEPVGGVLVQSTYLYRDAGWQYAKVGEEPVMSGMRVEVLDVLEDGKWVKIVTTDGTLGYIPYDSIRVI